MEKSRLLGTVCACLAAVSINANAVVINTLNGINYEWLELTATLGMSRLEVEDKLFDVSSPLYGYEYASRALVEDLLLSYASWDGSSGYYGESTVVSGGKNYLDDFGRTIIEPGDGTNTELVTNEGDTVNIDGYSAAYGWFGTRDECSHPTFPDPRTCYSRADLYTDAQGTATAFGQYGHMGWSDTLAPITTYLYTKEDISFYGSHLVKIASVPTPAALWLFASGLLGLIGAARRKARV